MTLGKLEKAAALTGDRVVLGHRDSAPAIMPEPEWQTEQDASQVATPSLDEVLDALHERERELDGLRRELAALREKNSQSEARVQQWQEERDALQAQAVERGFEQGQQDAQQQAQTELQKQVELWLSGVEQLAQQHAEQSAAITAQLADLAMAAVTKIIGEHLTDAAAVQRGVEHIVRESGELGPLKIFVAPRHYEQLMALPDLQWAALRGRQVEVFPDARVEYGGCLLETANGAVDGRYEMQLAKLRDIVRG